MNKETVTPDDPITPVNPNTPTAYVKAVAHVDRRHHRLDRDSDNQMTIYAEHGHLGGYAIGGDDATLYQDLWLWLLAQGYAGTVLDIGCGEGHALKFFRQFGAEVLGVDGVPQDDADIVVHDFTKGRFFFGPVVVDLVWCCEFVEHVDETYLPNFLHLFKSGRRVLLTHAEPGQPGYHHVNCRPAEYWKGVMAGAGFTFDEELTDLTREFSRLNPSPWNHYARSGLAFRQ